jgi:hypothetical protein
MANEGIRAESADKGGAVVPLRGPDDPVVPDEPVLTPLPRAVGSIGGRGLAGSSSRGRSLPPVTPWTFILDLCDSVLDNGLRAPRRHKERVRRGLLMWVVDHDQDVRVAVGSWPTTISTVPDKTA